MTKTIREGSGQAQTDANELISVIVPVYKAAEYIDKTIETVTNQTYTNWELLLVDDCSPDDSAEVIIDVCSRLPDNIRGRIHLIRKSINEGAAKARNTGVDESKGRYIAFLDADDIWDEKKLELELDFMSKHDAPFAFTSYKFADENAIPNGKVVRVPKTLTYKKALSRTVIFTSTVMIDTCRVDRKNLYMPDIGSEDTATWWKLLKTGITAFGLDIPLAIYRRPAVSLSSNKQRAVVRIWNLYRSVAGLSVAASFFYLMSWAFRAAVRRVVDDTFRNHIEAVKRFAVVQLSLIGILIQTALYATVWFKVYYPVISSARISQDGYYMGYGLKLFFRGHILILTIYFLLLLFLSKTNGGMRTGYNRPRQIIGSMVTSLFYADMISYAQISLMRNWLVPVVPMAVTLILQTIVSFVWANISDFIYRNVFPARETLIITGSDTRTNNETVKMFGKRPDRFQIMRVMSIDDGYDRLINECLRWYGCVVISGVKGRMKEEIVQFCYGHYIRVYVVPSVSDLLLQSSEQVDLLDSPVLELREYSIRWEERVVKRISDVLISIICLILCSPVALFRAVTIKLSGRPVIITTDILSMASHRVSIHTFNCEGFGRSIPMLADILRGRLSVTGPEPVPEGIMQKLIDADPRFSYRLRVKAGYTGYTGKSGRSYWKLVYSGDEITDYETAYELLKMDLIYIQHYSLLQDFRIIILHSKSCF